MPDDQTQIRQFHAGLLAFNGGTWFSFEPHLAALYRAVLHPGCVAVDGGANVGYHTLQMAQAVQPDGIVLAIEPVTELLRQVDESRESSGISADVVRLLPFGLSSQPGEAEFFQVLDPVLHQLSGLRNREFLDSDKVQSIRVQLTTLDELCRDLARLDFIKLDLEGAEMDALKASVSTLQRFRPVLAIEQSHDSPGYFGYSWGDLLRFFAALDYELYDLFGLRYTVPDMLESCAVWDFVAIPAEHPDKARLFDAVRRSMHAYGVLPPETGASKGLSCDGATAQCWIDQIGSIISPATNSPVEVKRDQATVISGWAIDEQHQAPAASVEIAVDDHPYRTLYGGERPDVAAHFGDEVYRNTGFRVKLPAGAVAPGEHVVSLRVLAHDGNSYIQGTTVVVIAA